MRLWKGETVSLLGDQFTGLAIPFIGADVILKGVDKSIAAPQMGLLGAVAFAPFLLFGLVVGVWVDRHRPRRIMMYADFARGVLVVLIPIGAVFGFLTMPLLYFVSFFHGTFTVFFDVAYQSYIPALVDRNQIVDANGKLEASRATMSSVGPSLAGVTIQAITAPMAEFFDSISFYVSFIFLGRIKKPDIKPEVAEGSTILSEAREGMGVVFKNSTLWHIAGCTGTSNFFTNASGALFLLFLAAQLNISEGLPLGIIFSLGSIGAIIGALTGRRVADRMGVGSAIIVSIFLGGLGGLLVPIATPVTAFPFLIVSAFAGSWASVVYNINQVSLRQAITPLRLQGRMNATMRFIVWGTIPIGALTGGFLGATIGYRPAIAIAAVGGLLAFAWVLISPVRKLREIPPPGE